MLIDAGSSGSRVYVYQWAVDRQEISNTKIDEVPGYTRKTANPGTILFTSALPSIGKSRIVVKGAS